MAQALQLLFEVEGETLIDRTFQRRAKNIGHAEPAFRKIADQMMKVAKTQFASEGGARSGGWAALKEETLAAKRRKGLNMHILRATDALMNSLIKRGGSGQKLIITAWQLVFGSNVPYFPFHQKGAPGANIPRRQILMFNESDKRGYVKLLQRYIMTGEV